MDEFDRIDWNLVPALHALLRERNVSQAARRLTISQPAASRALARLRRHFKDELLVRNGAGYALTPLAIRLLEPARDAVDSTRGLFGAARSFDPSETERHFVLAASEYGQGLFGGALLRRLSEQAPLATLEFRGMRGKPDDFFPTVDGWIGPRDSRPGTPNSGLFTDRWVCVVDRHSDTDALPLEAAHERRWVVPTAPGDAGGPWRQRLLGYGLELNIVVTTETFAAVPYLVAGTDHVGIVQAGLLERMGEETGVRPLELPWPMRPLSFTMWWHANRENDAAHEWFRSEVAACFDEVAARRSSLNAETTDGPDLA